MFAESAPHAAAEHPNPDNAHVTPFPAASFETVAEKACVSPSWTAAVGGDTATEIGLGETEGLVVVLVLPTQPATLIKTNVTETACRSFGNDK